MPLRVVVDACVGRSAGEKKVGSSLACANCLMEIREKTAHKAVMTNQLRAEWQKHASKIAVMWLTAMQRAGRVTSISNPQTVPVELKNYPSSERRAISKDIHLFEAAHSTDRTIITIEKRCLNALSSREEGMQFLCTIEIYNPIEDDIEVLRAWG